MSEKIRIEMYGIKNQTPPSGCSSCSGCKSSGDCDPSLTMGEMFDGLSDFIESSDINDKVELEFIDIDNENLDSFENVKNALELGNRPPIIAIAGELKFQGGVYFQLVYQEVQKKLQQVT